MDFLWLAYRKYEFKYTIIRWTWYIVVRTLVVCLVGFSFNLSYISLNYLTEYSDFVNCLNGIVPIIDFIQFVYYSKRFYLHLKSREEIRIFYFYKEAYLDSK